MTVKPGKQPDVPESDSENKTPEVQDTSVPEEKEVHLMFPKVTMQIKPLKHWYRM